MMSSQRLAGSVPLGSSWLLLVRASHMAKPASTQGCRGNMCIPSFAAARTRSSGRLPCFERVRAVANDSSASHRVLDTSGQAIGVYRHGLPHPLSHGPHGAGLRASQGRPSGSGQGIWTRAGVFSSGFTVVPHAVVPVTTLCSLPKRTYATTASGGDVGDERSCGGSEMIFPYEDFVYAQDAVTEEEADLLLKELYPKLKRRR